MVVIPEDREELKRLYNKHVGIKDTFIFKGQEMNVKYIKYLLEYLKGK